MKRERQWHRRALVGGVTALLLGPASPSTGLAAAVAGGWQGTLTLGAFPCPGAGTCSGSFSGLLTGSVAGLDTAGHPFAVVWPDPTAPPTLFNLTAAFTYGEDCPLGATGGASGTFTLTGGYVDHNGVTSHDGAMSGQFAWVRVGLAVVISTGGGVVTGGGQTLATQQTIGQGAGAFAPLSVPGDCLSIQSLTAKVTGAFGEPE